MSILIKSLATIVWLVCLCIGFALAWQYESTSGTPADAPADLPRPAGSNLPRLILFAHPECPCTRASIEQLKEIAQRQKDRLSITIYFVQPEGLTGDLGDWSLAQRAKDIHGAQIQVDRNGQEAKRFGAVTSGQVLLYSSTGKKLFSGGITKARGHLGESAGQTAINAILDSKPIAIDSAPVYGCSLLGGS